MGYALTDEPGADRPKGAAHSTCAQPPRQWAQPDVWARIGELVGQRNLAVTANTYTHVLVDESEIDYAALLDSLADPLSSQEGPDVLQQHEEMERVSRRLLETELHVPLLCCFVLRMDEEHARADRVRRLYAS